MTWTLAFPESRFGQLCTELLAQEPHEAGAILLCNRAGPDRLAVEEVRVAAARDFRVQDIDRLEFTPSFLAAAVKVARERQQSVVLVHTHPFSATPRFSGTDDLAEAKLLPSLYQRAPNGPHGSLVLGTSGFHARVQISGGYQEISHIVEVGPQVLLHQKSNGAKAVAELYDRNVRAFGESGQRRLGGLVAAVVGLGGTGSLVAQQLSHLGVKRLLLIDDDNLSTTNLNRVVGARPQDVGVAKALIASKNVASISGGRVESTALVGNVLDERIGIHLLNCDVVFGCTDTHGSRALINQIAYQYLVPTIDMGLRIDSLEGRIIGMAARVQMLAPGLPCLQCQALLDPEAVRRDFLSDAARRADPYIVGDVIAQPAVISLNGVTSSLAVTMLLSAFAGLPVPARWLNYRISESVVRPVRSEPNPNCIVCSATRGALAKGDRWPLYWRP